MSSVLRCTHLQHAALLAMLLPSTAVSYTTTPLPSGGFYWDMAVDNRHRHVFISKGDSITVTDFDGNLVTTMAGEPDVRGMALDRRDRALYVALGSSDAIAQIDTETFAEIAKRSLGLGGACPGMINMARHLVWFGFTCESACNCGTFAPGGIGSLDFRRSRLNLFTGARLSAPNYFPVVKSTPRVRNVLVAGDLYLSSGPLTKYRIAREGTPHVETYQSGGDNLEDFAITPDGAHVIAAAGGVYHLSSFGLSNFAPDAEYPTGPYPQAVAITSDSRYVAAGLSPGVIQIYPTGQTVPLATFDLVRLASGPYLLQAHGIAFSQAADRLFA